VCVVVVVKQWRGYRWRVAYDIRAIFSRCNGKELKKYEIKTFLMKIKHDFKKNF
jgi:hypothetical protein